MRGHYYAKCFPSKTDPAKIILEAGYAFLPDFYEHKRHTHKYKLSSSPHSAPYLSPLGCHSSGVCYWFNCSHPMDEITQQGEAMEGKQQAAKEHQLPWMNPWCKPAPRFEVMSRMTQIFLHAQLHPGDLLTKVHLWSNHNQL